MVTMFPTAGTRMFWVAGVDGHINFEVECREEANDGLVCDGGHSAGMSGCYNFCHCLFDLFMYGYCFIGSSTLLCSLESNLGGSKARAFFSRIYSFPCNVI